MLHTSLLLYSPLVLRRKGNNCLNVTLSYCKLDVLNINFIRSDQRFIACTLSCPQTHALGKKNGKIKEDKKEVLKNLASSILFGISYMFYSNRAVIIYYYVAATFSVSFMILQNSVAPVVCFWFGFYWGFCSPKLKKLTCTRCVSNVQDVS